jgi:uncharacterized protein with HEPN domain
MQEDDLVRLRHMLDAGRKAVSFSEGTGRSDLDADSMLAFALMKAIEIMGEAATKVSHDCRKQFTDIPWPQVIGMRNRLIHGYDEINLDVLWQTVTRNLPPLIEALDRIIASESSE